MKTLLRRHWVSLACLALAAVVSVAAIADHRNKTSRALKAEVLEWCCAHDGTHCGGPSSERIETNWNQRQLGYEIAVGSLGGAALVVFFRRALRPARRQRS
jgi:hypothetical protein